MECQNEIRPKGLIIIHQGLLKFHQDSKVAKLGFYNKSQLTLTKYNFLILYDKWPIKRSFWRGCNFLQSIIIPPSSKNALTRSYEFGHYRSFLKINKNTFFSKAYNLSMEYLNKMIPKLLVRGHRKLSKKSNNTSKSSKLKKLCIVEVGHFCKIAKSQLSPKLQILSNWPILFHLIWVCIIVHGP